MKVYTKIFATEEQAFNWMRMKNRACKKANNNKDIFVMVDGPSDDFAVMDIDSAIKNEFFYSWSK